MIEIEVNLPRGKELKKIQPTCTNSLTFWLFAHGVRILSVQFPTLPFPQKSRGRTKEPL